MEDRFDPIYRYRPGIILPPIEDIPPPPRRKSDRFMVILFGSPVRAVLSGTVAWMFLLLLFANVPFWVGFPVLMVGCGLLGCLFGEIMG